MDLDEVAGELYAAPRDEFVPLRDERAAQAKADGDKALASEIKKLRKPSTAAWLVNRVATEHSGDLDDLTDLGKELLRAHSELDGKRLRELSSRRREDVQALVDRAREIGEREGQPPGSAVLDQVRDTLEAAVSNPDAADTVASGRLEAAVSATGFEQWLSSAPAPAAGPRKSSKPSKPSRAAPRPSKRKPAEREDADDERRRRALQQAKERAEAADADRERAQQRMADAKAEADAARETVKDLKTQLVRAERRERDARAIADTARREHDKAARDAEAAHRELQRHRG